MAGKSDIRAGGAFVELFTKNGPLVKGLQSASRTLTSWGRSVATLGAGVSAIGAAIVAPLAAAVTHFAAAGSELADLSARTGQSVGSLAELKFAAEQTGASLADIEIAIRNQQRVGIAETFDQVAARIAAIEDPAERTRQAIEAWGKSGTKLLPMVENLAALRAEARELGLVPTESAVAMADQIGDEFDKVKAVGMAAFFEIGAAIAPLLLPALQAVKQIGASVVKWVRDNGQLVRTIALVGAGLLVAGAAITTIGVGLAGIGMVLGGIASLVTFLASPLGLIVVGVGALAVAATAAAVAFVKFTDLGRGAAASIASAFRVLSRDVRDSLQLIFDAMTGGHWELAGEILGFAVAKAFADAMVQLNEDTGGILGDFILGADAREAQTIIGSRLMGLRKMAAKMMAEKSGRGPDFGGGISEFKAATAREVVTAGSTHQAPRRFVRTCTPAGKSSLSLTCYATSWPSCWTTTPPTSGRGSLTWLGRIPSRPGPPVSFTAWQRRNARLSGRRSLRRTWPGCRRCPTSWGRPWPPETAAAGRRPSSSPKRGA